MESVKPKAPTFPYFMGDSDSAYDLAQSLNRAAFAAGEHRYHKAEPYRNRWRVRVRNREGQSLGFAL